ncbi:MAG: glycosyltransferase [Candidatus Rifleibacteriota bacterium]
MRIIHALEGSGWSGGQQQALFLAQQQHLQGHEVLLVCQKGSVLEGKAVEAGLKVRPNNYRKELHPLSLYNLLKIYDEFKPDVVNVHRAWAHTQWLLISLLRRFKGLIVTRRVLFKPDFNPVSRAKYCTSAIRGYIAVSQAVAERLKETGVNQDKIRVVYSATDTDRFSPVVEHQLNGPWPVGTEAKVALLVGNFHPNKGHLLLLKAFNLAAEKWPDLHLVVAGQNTACDELKKLAAEKGFAGRIHLLGFRDDVPALMSRSLFTINASYQEGFSGTVRESLALGVPVLASDIPANVEMNSLVPLRLFNCGDEKSLSEGLLSFSQRPVAESERQSLRRLAVERFSVPAMVKATLDAYKELL